LEKSSKYWTDIRCFRGYYNAQGKFNMREMVVARAAPLACILGAPSNPKINTAFSPIFKITAQELINAQGFT